MPGNAQDLLLYVVTELVEEFQRLYQLEQLGVVSFVLWKCHLGSEHTYLIIQEAFRRDFEILHDLLLC
jgi:hypothetical protein